MIILYVDSIWKAGSLNVEVLIRIQTKADLGDVAHETLLTRSDEQNASQSVSAETELRGHGRREA